MFQFLFLLMFSLFGCNGCNGAPDASQWNEAMAQGRVAYADGRYDDAGLAFETAVKASQELPDRAKLTESLYEAARARMGNGDLGESEELLNRAMRVAEKELGADNVWLPRNLEALAEVYLLQGRDDMAETSLVKAIELRKKQGAADAEIAPLLAKLGRLYLKKHRWTDAERRLKRAAAIYQADTETNPEELVMLRIDLSVVYRGQKKLDAAASELEIAADTATSFLGNEHPLVASVYSHQGEVHRLARHYPKAIVAFKKAADLCFATLGVGAPECGLALHNLASTTAESGDFDKAAEIFAKALPLREAIAKRQPGNVATTYEQYAKVERARSNDEAAEKLEARAKELRAEAGEKKGKRKGKSKGGKAKGGKSKGAKGEKSKGGKSKGAKTKEGKSKGTKSKGTKSKGAKGKGGK